MVAGAVSTDSQAVRHRCRLTQIALYDGPFVQFGVYSHVLLTVRRLTYLHNYR